MKACSIFGLSLDKSNHTGDVDDSDGSVVEEQETGD